MLVDPVDRQQVDNAVITLDGTLVMGYIHDIHYVHEIQKEENMSRIAAGDLRKDVAEVLNKVAYGHERIIVHRRGKDAAVIIPLEDLELLESLEDQQDLEDAQAARAEAKEKGTIPWDQLKSELDL
jgi:prevent-host-death family protein